MLPVPCPNDLWESSVAKRPPEFKPKKETNPYSVSRVCHVREMLLGGHGQALGR